MGYSPEDFYNNRFSTVLSMINMYTDKKMMESAIMQNKPYKSKYFNINNDNDVRQITSLKEIDGW